MAKGVPILITLAGEPKGKGRPRFNSRNKTAYTPAKTRHYEAALKDVAIKVMGDQPLLEGPLQVEITASMSVPKSWSKSKKAAALLNILKPIKRPDFDNYAKSVDALNGVVWFDDSQIVDGRIIKVYSSKPSLTVKVMQL